MGFKRPFDEEGLLEFPLKHPKQLDCDNKLTLFSEVYPTYYDHPQKADAPAEGNNRLGSGLNHDSRGVASYMANTDFESYKEEHAASPTAVCPVLSPDRFDFPFPRRPVVQPQDAYSVLLAGPPVKGVPIGPNHQAEIPEWDPHSLEEKGTDCSAHTVDTREGSRVIATPSDMSARDCVNVGRGRTYCLCLDQGSIRCVRQHVKEARETLREALGHDKFAGLGFCDMGEEVAQRWTEEEEWVFQKVVYSNPASLRRNFWEHLSVVFPSRTTKEIVSYYFNVFMLRRRGVQNRSTYLHSDSDDDEWQGSDECPYDDENAALGDQGVGVNHEEDFSEDDGSEDHDDDDDDGGECSIENDSGSGLLINDQRDASMESYGCEFLVNPADSDSSGSTAKRSSDVQDSGLKSDCKEDFHGNDDYLLEEPLDAKLWFATMSPLKCVDLLPPTRNIIDEIFGPCDKL